MGTAAAIFNHAMAAGQALSGTAASPMAGSANGSSGTPQANASGGSDDSSSGSATISANDFLTLLVTEMQNQDPTADTDPNEYINQLVQVNSLEQLIDINQTLGGALGSTTPSTGDGSSAQVVAAVPKDTSAASPLTAATAQTGRAGGVATAATSSAGGAVVPQTSASSRVPSHAPGNLGVPGVNAAAQHVGHALDGRAHLKPVKGSAIALQ